MIAIVIGPFNSISPSRELLETVIGLLVAIIGVAFPLSIDTIARSLKDYRNEHLTNMFKDEFDYQYLKWCVVPIVILNLLFLLFLPDCSNNPQCLYIACLISVFTCAISLVEFMSFMTKFTKYIVMPYNEALQYIERQKKNIENVQKKSGRESIIQGHSDVLEMYCHVLQRMIREKNFSEYRRGFTDMTAYIAELLDNKSNQTDERSIRNTVLFVLFNTYSNFFSLLRKEGLNVKSEEVEEMLKIYHNQIEPICDKGTIINADIYFMAWEEFAKELHSKDINSNPNLCNIPWKWFFALWTDNVPEVKTASMQKALFEVIKNLIDNKTFESIKAFIDYSDEIIRNSSTENLKYEYRGDKLKEEAKNQIEGVYSETDYMFCNVTLDTIDDNDDLRGILGDTYYSRLLFTDLIRIGAYSLYKADELSLRYLLSSGIFPLVGLASVIRIFALFIKDKIILYDKELPYKEKRWLIKFLSIITVRLLLNETTINEVEFKESDKLTANLFFNCVLKELNSKDQQSNQYLCSYKIKDIVCPIIEKLIKKTLLNNNTDMASLSIQNNNIMLVVKKIIKNSQWLDIFNNPEKKNTIDITHGKFVSFHLSYKDDAIKSSLLLESMENFNFVDKLSQFILVHIDDKICNYIIGLIPLNKEKMIVKRSEIKKLFENLDSNLIDNAIFVITNSRIEDFTFDKDKLKQDTQNHCKFVYAGKATFFIEHTKYPWKQFYAINKRKFIVDDIIVNRANVIDLNKDQYSRTIIEVDNLSSSEDGFDELMRASLLVDIDIDIRLLETNLQDSTYLYIQ